MPFEHDELGVPKLKIGRCIKRYGGAGLAKPQDQIGSGGVSDVAPGPRDFFFIGGDSGLLREVDQDKRKNPGIPGMVSRVALTGCGVVFEETLERRHKKEPCYVSELMRERPEGIGRVGRQAADRAAREKGKRAFESITHRPTGFGNPCTREVYDADGAKRSFPHISLKPTAILPRPEHSSAEFEGGVKKFEESLSYDTRPLTAFDGTYYDPTPRKMVHQNRPVGAPDALGPAAGKSAWDKKERMAS